MRGTAREQRRASGAGKRRAGLARLPIALMALLGAVEAAIAAPPAKSGKKVVAADAAPVVPLPEVKPTGSIAAQYCEALRDAAAEARHAVQIAQLERLGNEIDARLVRLDARSAELKEWMARREEFARKATAQLVGIFAAMRPESASEQLVRLDSATAASILAKLDARAASAILNEMPPEKAAGLARLIAGAGRRDEAPGKP